MKQIVLAALLGYTAGVKLNESPSHPDSHVVFPTTERSPVSAGLIQTTACVSSGVQGVSCVPNSQLWAVGMKGDEDLNQDITMKGEKFHYHQEPSTDDKKPADK